ncbi:MAG: bacterial Ig-like domain-containing protein, partial [Gammaproteobacteria bacterium]|nr:bacterial Ig-like domain-containing protein [Gammaproteobacteria bacterium]
MKKKSNILSLILIVLLGLTLVGCKKKTKSTVTTKRTESTSQTTKGTSSSDTTKKPSSSDTTKKSSSSETQTVKPTETTKTPAVKLGTPVITLERSIITIIGSEGATKFKVVVEEQVIEDNLEARAYTLSNITNPGTYHVYVIALGDGVNTLDSDKSNTIEYVVKEPPIETIQLRTPQIVLNETSVTWTEVAHATKYEVYVNDEVKDSNVTTTSYSLSSITEDGTYKIKVKAIGDDHMYTDSNFSNEVTYAKSSSETPIKLNAPVIVLDNVSQKITWEAVTGAESYQVYFNGTVNGLPITATEVAIIPILPPGEYKVTVKALGDEVNTLDSDLSNEVTFVIEDDVTYDSLEVTGVLERTKYYIGVDTEIDLTGLTFKAVYSDGEKLELDMYQDLTISPVDLTTAGTKTVTISYTEMGDTHSVEITISVEQMEEVSSISIVVAPTAKTEYEEGEYDSLILAGITITVTYTTGTQETNIRVKESMIDESTYDLDTAGTYPVKVTYAGKSSAFDIIVNAPAPVVVGLRIDGTLAKSTFKVNHELTLDDLSGITLTAIYSDDSEAPLTITLSMLRYNFSEPGDAVITIYYQDESEELFVTVENYVTGIQVASKNEDKYSYERNNTDADFLATNTISKVMAAGDPVQLTASELAAVEFTTITPGHREITFTFGDFTVKHTYDITYILRVDYDWQVVQTYLDGYYELGDNITVSDLTSEVGLAPMYAVDAGGYYDYDFDGEGNGTEQGQIGRAFTGKFDGKGYTISDIRVVHDGETVESYGLAIFGWIGEGGIVENFKVKNATIKGWQRLSFLVG